MWFISPTRRVISSIDKSPLLRFTCRSRTLHSRMSDFPPPALREVAEEVAAILRQRKETISVAETAAGGLVSAALLATPGASKIYKGGLTLYTLESRIAFAGWTQGDLDTYDGPTPKLVAGLAIHVRKTLKSTYAVGEVRCFPSSMQRTGLKLIYDPEWYSRANCQWRQAQQTTVSFRLCFTRRLVAERSLLLHCSGTG